MATSTGTARRRLGVALRQLREQRGRTLEEAARALERSPATISRLERGNTIPRVRDIRDLALFFEATADERDLLFRLVDESQRSGVDLARPEDRYPEQVFETGYDAQIQSCLWSPNGKILAAVLATGSIWLGEADDLRHSQKISFSSSGTCVGAAWTSDSGRLIIATTEEIVMINAADGAINWRKDSGGAQCIAVSWQDEIALGGARGLQVLNQTGNAILTVELEITPTTIGWLERSNDIVIAGMALDNGDQSAIHLVVNGHVTRVGHIYGSHSAIVGLDVDPNTGGFWSYSEDRVARLWARPWRRAVLELDDDAIGRPAHVACSDDGELIVLRTDEVLSIWSRRRKELVGQFENYATPGASGAAVAGFRPHNREYAFARAANIVLLEFSQLAPRALDSGRTVRHRSAKVVLLGDSGVGKSGLALVLTRKPYRATDSTHGRQVEELSQINVNIAPHLVEHRETVLWDLAGQPGYRMFHRLSLRDIALALVVFDARSESAPFSGVRYWARALDEAAASTRVLVSARADRGGLPVSNARRNKVISEYGFRAFVETSAATGLGIKELRSMITNTIDWEALPSVSATSLLLDVQDFVVKLRQTGRVIAGFEDLLEEFEQQIQSAVEPELFRNCLTKWAIAGLLQNLTLRDYWLIKPEALDGYAAALALAARAEPDGLGYIAEAVALTGLPNDDLSPSSGEAPLVRLTAVEELVGQGIALAANTERGRMLIFPSEVREDLPDRPHDYALSVVFSYEGPVRAIYSIIVVRLANSITFRRHELYRDAALFTGPSSYTCGLSLSYPIEHDDATGRITTFFGPTTTRDIKLIFLRYIQSELEALALGRSVVRERVYQCSQQHPPIGSEWVKIRRDMGAKTVLCPGCAAEIPFDELDERSTETDRAIGEMGQNAQEELAIQKRITSLAARTAAKKFELLICYNSQEKLSARAIKDHLEGLGVCCWLDDDMKDGGQPVGVLDEMLDSVRVAAILVGPSSLGRWQTQEYRALLTRLVENSEISSNLKIFAVLAPGAPMPSKLPAFLRTFPRIDLRGLGSLAEPHVKEELRRIALLDDLIRDYP